MNLKDQGGQKQGTAYASFMNFCATFPQQT